MNLIFFGCPGSGKGTVAQQMIDFIQISTGELLRKEVLSGSVLGKEIDALISKGKFVSDEMALNVIKENTKNKGNYIFDGFPRTLRQAEMLSEILPKEETVIVIFDIEKGKIEDRIVNRRSCPNCSKIYNLKFSPPKNSNLCDKCSVELFHRNDDREDVLESRLALYETNSHPIINYYKNHQVIHVNSDQNPQEVVNELLKKLNLLDK